MIMKTYLFIAALWCLSASGQVVVESGLVERIEVLPGDSAVVPLRLRNSGKDSVRCSLTISDVVSKCDSGYTYLEPGSTAESCSPWLLLETENFELAPGEHKMVKALLRIPSSYRRAGARSCILVNSAPLHEQQKKGALKIRVRYAINFLYRNPTIAGVVALHAQRLEMHKDRPFWALQYQNQGDVDRIVRSHAQLLDQQGNVVYSQYSESARGMMPNQCRTLRFPMPEIPAGTYHMVVLSETDKGERFGMTKEVQWED